MSNTICPRCDSENIVKNEIKRGNHHHYMTTRLRSQSKTVGDRKTDIPVRNVRRKFTSHASRLHRHLTLL